MINSETTTLAKKNTNRLLSLTLVATQGKMPDGSLERMRGNVEVYKSSPLKMGLAANQLLDRYLTKSLKENDFSGYALLRENIIGMTVDAYAFSSEAINAIDYDDYLNVNVDLDISYTDAGIYIQIQPEKIVNAELSLRLKGEYKYENYRKTKRNKRKCKRN